MFDYIRCRHPLPIPEAVGVECQTKDTPVQYLDNYEIREDGTLWHEAHDIEDRSDPNATGLGRLMGMATPVNHRWEPEPFTGEIVFYGTTPGGVEFEYSAYFVRGQLKHLEPLGVAAAGRAAGE
ncbi:MAG TPA: hypothetical protein VEA69_21120 [Tepidisphaeraceae bacterium]|nr:hypothetical protein [Tepidisphaeraceae bacterium]